MDTIFALATASGKAGVAVFRLSGGRAHATVRSLCDRLPKPRIASVRTLRFDGEVLDEALVLLFEHGSSFTGEEMAELHIHGSRAVIHQLTRVLSGTVGIRQAEPGEFTRRALENGRLDLTQVEGLADLIDAETEAQRRQAVRVLTGAVGDVVKSWRRNLVRASALIEATIDFVEEDVPIDVGPEVLGLVGEVLSSLQKESAGSAITERVRDGFEVAIIGPPNIGKSSLLNALAGREAAITSARAGTTRDVIEVRMDLSGLPVTLLDTAGLRESDDEVERIGIDRGLRRAELADLRVFLVQDHGAFDWLEPRQNDIVLLGKADLRGNPSGAISGTSGFGVDSLVAQIGDILKSRVAGSGVMTRERHRTAIRRAVECLDAVVVRMKNESYQRELVAADLWLATKSLDQLMGRVDVEDLLGEIFASFCIGK